MPQALLMLGPLPLFCGSSLRLLREILLLEILG
jgi:hypothetical protein